MGCYLVWWVRLGRAEQVEGLHVGVSTCHGIKVGQCRAGETESMLPGLGACQIQVGICADGIVRSWLGARGRES